MAPAVFTPVEGFTGTVVGVHFRDGAGETDDPAALGYFHSAGYRIEDAAAVTPEVAPEVPAVAENPPAPVPAPLIAPEPHVPPVEPQDGPKRPYPQANKAEWFEYLSKVKPGHGLVIEDNTKNEIIAAVDAK